MEDASILHLRVVSRDSHGRCCGVDDHKRQPVRSAACDVDIRPALGDLGQARRFRGWILLAESALWITDDQSIVLKSYLIQNKVASTRVFAGEVIDLGRCWSSYGAEVVQMTEFGVAWRWPSLGDQPDPRLQRKGPVS
jgi:hypothetical protein